MKSVTITKIEAYKTSDGKIFTDEQNAISHESEIGLREEVLELFASNLLDLDNYDREKVADFIVKNVNKLRAVINPPIDESMLIGYEIGERCNRICKGTIIEKEVEGCCSCHLGNPPCSYCTAGKTECNTCNWEMENV